MVWSLWNRTFWEAGAAVRAGNGVHARRGADKLGSIIYVYAFPRSPGLSLFKIPPQEAANGVDRGHGWDITNVNTLIVGADCHSVITSHPGLPQVYNYPNGAATTYIV